MYVWNGLMYGGGSGQEFAVVECRYVGDEIFLATFNTGETRLLDVTCLFSMPAFEPLKDPGVLEGFSIEDDVLVWLDGEIDIAPEGLYARSFEYETVA